VFVQKPLAAMNRSQPLANSVCVKSQVSRKFKFSSQHRLISFIHHSLTPERQARIANLKCEMTVSSTLQHEDGIDLKRNENAKSVIDDESEQNGDPSAAEVECSVDQVSRLMREQDADLLESMHYAASQVSQYSPAGTPRLRPQDRSLPLEDLPLMLMPPASMNSDVDSPSSRVRTSSFADENAALLQATSAFTPLMPLGEMFGKSTSSNTDPGKGDIHKFRRLLSGEVRTIDREEEEKSRSEEEEEEEETTASPICVAQEVETTINNEKDPGLAERRRVSEAIQFAEAVGEEISMNQEELCIIEDHTDGGESDDSDDDDDEACESKEGLVTTKEASLHIQADSRPEDSTLFPQHVDVLKAPDRPRRKFRPAWPFGPAGSEFSFLENLRDKVGENNFVYKGICANPPEITKRGIQRGNYAQCHRKAWLEVSDKYHRYGKNLRSYYRYWERLDFPTNQFFEWLDSKGEAAGQPLPNLDECPRSILDSYTVLYITKPEVTESYAIDIVCGEDGRGRVIDVDGDPVLTGPDGWIFVLRDNVLYAAEKITSISGHSKQRFHHSSFFGGKAVSSAGIIITEEEGYLTRLYPHSGHYRPGEAHVQRMLFFLHRKGVDLRTFRVDTQQFSHVSRDKDFKTKEKDGQKKHKKVDSLHLERAVNVACFLSHKAGFIGRGIFDKIHMIRKADVTSVSEALEMVDDGGFRQRK
jgi:hypothetical protein